jgi:hypothetical protein
MDPLSRIESRCVGTIEGPSGDCDNPPTQVLLTLGIIDEEGQAFSAGEVEKLEPAPVAFVVCSVHKKAVVRWAREMWGSYSDGDLYPVAALPGILQHLHMDGEVVSINPEPSWALQIDFVSHRSAG